VDFGIPNIVCHLADVALAKLRSTAENRINFELHTRPSTNNLIDGELSNRMLNNGRGMQDFCKESLRDNLSAVAERTCRHY
jgi:hypothetical protein